MTALAQAWRALARRRGFTLVAIITLAAGAGVTGAVFSIVHGILWRPLPYPEASQLVALYEAHPGDRQRVSLIAPGRLEDWRRLSRAFVAMSGSYAESVTDTSGAEPERLDGRRVAAGFFDVYRASPMAGRTFLPEEERFGGPAAAVIAEDVWARRFARSPAAIGQRLIVGGTAYTIVGVMPRAFAPGTVDVWLPAQIAPGLMQARQARFLTGIGRLRPGVTLEDGRADLVRVQRDLGAQYPASDAGWSADVRDLRDVRVGEYRRPLVMLLAAVGVLFAIAIANVAGLVLVQLHRRAGEFALRSALGASPGRMVAGLAREFLLLGAAASVLAGALAWTLTRAAASLFTEAPRAAELTLDVPSLLLVIGSAVAAAMACGLLPVMAGARTGLAPRLASGGRSIAGGRHRLQHAAVVVQIALGVTLAGCAGLLVRSYAAMSRVDAGFDAHHVLTFHVGAAWDEDRARIGQMQLQLLAGLERLPGVRAAGFANFLPATGATLRYQVRVDGLASGEGNGAFTVGQRTVTAGYLRALAVPLVAGRWCEPPRADLEQRTVRDAMVNRAFVERVAGGRELLGRQFSIVQQGSTTFRIAGIVGDVLEDGPSAPAAPYIYTCLPAGAWPDPEYVVRADGDARALAPAVRALVRATEPARPIFAMRPLDTIVDGALERPRLNAAAVSAFAGAALLIAALGLYSLMTLLVGERRREIGVRLALGASAGEIVRLVAGGASRLVLVGVAAGMALTFAATPLLRSLLFGVASADPLALAGAAIALGAAAFAALVVPVRHALSVSAVEAMRGE